MNVTQNSKRPMVHVRVWVSDVIQGQQGNTILEFTLGLDAEEFTRACMAIHNVGIFVNHDGENVWYPPRSIVKVIEVKKSVVV
jgi:hypothetical protein